MKILAKNCLNLKKNGTDMSIREKKLNKALLLLTKNLENLIK
jgi:hypothetical protein